MFDYAFPDSVFAATKHANKKPDDNKGKNDGKGKKDDKGKKEPIQTQMIGEKPGDDLGYDPDKIPTETID